MEKNSAGVAGNGRLHEAKALKNLAGRTLSITGRLRHGRNGSTGKLVLGSINLTIGSDGEREHESESSAVPCGYVELRVPDEKLVGCQPGTGVAAEAMIAPEDIAKLPPNACLKLNGETGGKYALAIFKKAAGMVRFVSKPQKDDVKGFHPRDARQSLAQGLLLDPDIKLVALPSKAGTGKTSLALYAGLKSMGRFPNKTSGGEFGSRLDLSELIAKQLGSRQPYDDGAEALREQSSPIVVCRPTHTIGKELGYLPGSLEEKVVPWSEAVWDAMEEMVSYATLKELVSERLLRVIPINHLRGRTIRRSFLVIDDAQNFTPDEVRTLVTRAGKATKVVFTGDPAQIDNRSVCEGRDGITHLVSRMTGWEGFGWIELVKNYRGALAEEAARRL